MLISSAVLSGSEIDRLLHAADIVRNKAYAPYSKFMVGTVLMTADGRIFAGCNVESADYDGTHAEESALAAMVAAGTRSPRAYLTVGGNEDETSRIVSSCGKCLQKIMEFASLSGVDPVIIVPVGGHSSLRHTYLSKLLPAAFGPADLLSVSDLAKYRR